MGRNPSPSNNKMDHMLNKGAWTVMEDQILIDYVKMYGEGRWDRVRKHTGLRRCGKSCRLRWLNYLRPDIKRGNISRDEEELIIRLHKLLGNRWSLIAGRLPGRTDNEVKNYWNTTLRKKLQSSDEQPKNPKPKRRITVVDPIAPSMAIEDDPLDEFSAAPREGLLIADRAKLEAEVRMTFPVTSEGDIRPWDFNMVDRKLDDTCFSGFLGSCLLEAGEVSTSSHLGSRQCDDMYGQPGILSFLESLEGGELSEEMLCEWADGLMD